jgi:hypothetical protein
MRVYWILPNRDQSDEVLASDGQTLLPLRQILDPKLRPDGFSPGVPTELLEKCAPRGYAGILFAQRFPGANGDKELFSVSSTAGLDSSGRVVHIGLLFVLEPGERPIFELPYSGLSQEDKASASALIHRLTSAGSGDPWVQSVRDLLALPSDAGPATNVALDRSVVQFHSPYVLGAGGLTKKAASRMKWLKAGIIVLIVLVVACVWLSAHAVDCSMALSGASHCVILLIGLEC